MRHDAVFGFLNYDDNDNIFVTKNILLVEKNRILILNISGQNTVKDGDIDDFKNLKQLNMQKCD